MTSGRSLVKGERLIKTADFRRAYSGASVKEPVAHLYFVANGSARTRVGFVVSKKVARLAWRRNAIKRRFKEHIRCTKAGLSAGWDLVFVVKRDIAGPEHRFDHKDVIDRLLRRSSII